VIKNRLFLFFVKEFLINVKIMSWGKKFEGQRLNFLLGTKFQKGIGADAIKKIYSYLRDSLFRSLDQRFSTQITPQPVFCHKLGRGRKDLLYGSLLGQFYLPPSNNKGLKVFKNVYIWVVIKFYLTKYPIH